MLKKPSFIKKQMRKIRTREHIIADLSVNHIEYYAIKCGFSVERIASDYGYDLQIYTYDENGEFENGTIYVQLKATDFIEKHKRKEGGFAISIEKAHLECWSGEPMPVMLVLYDVKSEIAYRVYVQAFLNSNSIDMKSGKKTHVIRFSPDDVVNESDMKKWRIYKNNILSQMDRKVVHYA